jgi:NADH-quinone oxidoreductase subunit E
VAVGLKAGKTDEEEIMTEERWAWEALDRIIDEHREEPGALIPLLQQAQGLYGFLPREVLLHISEKTGIPRSQIYGVATFYAQFYLQRRGKCIVRQCDGTACHVRGAGKIVEAIEQELGIKDGETTPDYKFTFEVVYCLGSCGLSPVAVVNDQVLGRLVPEKMIQVLKSVE